MDGNTEAADGAQIETTCNLCGAETTVSEDKVSHRTGDTVVIGEWVLCDTCDSEM